MESSHSYSTEPRLRFTRTRVNLFCLWRSFEPLVNERLTDYMVRAFDETFATTDKYKTNPRIGAYILALDRVSQVMHYRGFYA